MSVLSQRATLRWKEWVPLITQQQRLRNLIQVIAYNVRKSEKPFKCSYYYTLHLTTLSAPFYTSEKLESDNPKWTEVEINEVNGAANGVVIRLWCHNIDGSDEIVIVWGVYFSGLIYLGPRLLLTDPNSFYTNTIVFHMQGGYFTAPHCFKNKPPYEARLSTVQINSNDVRPSYTINLLLRLHTVQQAIKKQTSAAASLREQISAGNLNTVPEQRESAMLRRLLNRSRPKPQRKEILQIKKEVEIVKFRIQLLIQEKNRRLIELRNLRAVKDEKVEKNLEKDISLMNQYHCLHKDIDRLQEFRRVILENKGILDGTILKLFHRRGQLISELNYIYPIIQMPDKKYLICGVHLPDSENFAGHDEMMISIALGFVAHLVQMIAYFLHVPLRYPICHCGSRSKAIDHIIDKFPDKEREFPLFSRSKEKLLFNYGVYLLNKNIAQLRWYCGVSTVDLRATLHNLNDLMHLKTSHHINGIGIHKRTLSGTSLEIHDPASLSPRASTPYQRSVKPVVSSTLSFSLDKGLDEISTVKGKRNVSQSSEKYMSHVGSEPFLATGFSDENEKFNEITNKIKSLEKQSKEESFDSVEHKLYRDSVCIKKKEKLEEIEDLASLMGKMNSKISITTSHVDEISDSIEKKINSNESTEDSKTQKKINFSVNQTDIYTLQKSSKEN